MKKQLFLAGVLVAGVMASSLGYAEQHYGIWFYRPSTTSLAILVPVGGYDPYEEVYLNSVNFPIVFVVSAYGISSDDGSFGHIIAEGYLEGEITTPESGYPLTAMPIVGGPVYVTAGRFTNP